jgi:hypothetical protein
LYQFVLSATGEIAAFSLALQGGARWTGCLTAHAKAGCDLPVSGRPSNRCRNRPLVSEGNRSGGLEGTSGPTRWPRGAGRRDAGAVLRAVLIGAFDCARFLLISLECAKRRRVRADIWIEFKGVIALAGGAETAMPIIA